MHCYSPLLLFVLLSTCAAAEPDEKAFPDQVRDFLDSPWTELSITTALITDYKVVYGTSVQLRRADPKAPVQYTLPLTPGVPSKGVITEADLKTLYTDALVAARSTYEHRYPREILNAMPHEKALEMIKSGKLREGPNDTEILVIRGKTPKGDVSFTETGPYSPLDTTIQKLFDTKRVEMRESDYKPLLGLNPYEKA